MEAVKANGLEGRTTIFVVSDHGFASYTHVIRPDVVLSQHKLLPGPGHTGGVLVQPEGGVAEVFLRGTPDSTGREALKQQAARLFAAVPGVAHVASGTELQRLGLAQPPSTQAPDLYLLATPGYAFDGGTDGPLVEDLAQARGAHGYTNEDSEMQAIFVAAGAAIRPGVHLPLFPNLRVAPTLARVLGVSLPEAKAAPLTEILR